MAPSGREEPPSGRGQLGVTAEISHLASGGVLRAISLRRHDRRAEACRPAAVLSLSDALHSALKIAMSTTDDPLTELLGVDASVPRRRLGAAPAPHRQRDHLVPRCALARRHGRGGGARRVGRRGRLADRRAALQGPRAGARLRVGARGVRRRRVDRDQPRRQGARPPLNDLCAAGRAVPLRLRQPVLHAARVADGAAARTTATSSCCRCTARRQALARVAVRPLRRAAAAVCRRAGGQGAAAQARRADELGARALECTLQPGDALYIPRGAIHVAETAAAEGECSLHVTVAIPTADLCWSGFVAQAATRGCMERCRSAARCRSARCRARARSWREAFAARWEEMLAVELGDARRVLAQKMDRHRAQQADASARAPRRDSGRAPTAGCARARGCGRRWPSR